MTSSNKVVSAKQEKMVADYMGWKVVAGSGSRPFNPGDVNSFEFLVECKTHVDEKPNVVFYKKHWVKISEEARAKNRYPALIVDNGTQKLQNTWVLLPSRALPRDHICSLFGLVNTSTSGNTITFSNSGAYTLFKESYQDGMINYYVINFDNDKESLAILTLEEFRNYYRQEF